jgi:hypothetical protein
MNGVDMRPEYFFLYVAFSLAFLFFAWILTRGTRPLGSNLVLLGILVLILACGYGLIGIPTMMLVTPTLSKTGFLIVLGGLTWSLLVACPGPTAKETDHV